MSLGDRQYYCARGWECPKCGAVYAPTTPGCFKCTGETKTTNTTKQITQRDLLQIRGVIGDTKTYSIVDDDLVFHVKQQTNW